MRGPAGAGPDAQVEAVGPPDQSAWQRFWFEPASTATLAVFRIAFGLVVLAWTLSLAPDLSAFFSRSGIATSRARGWTTVLERLPSRPLVLGLFALLLVASCCLVVGWHTRLAAVAVFVGVAFVGHHNPLVLNAGDGLISNLAFFLMLAPAGAALSVDRWRAHKETFWEFPPRPPWALRLIQLQLSALYLATLWAKLQGPRWNDGTAVSYALRLGDLSRFQPPATVTESLLVSNLLTYGTLAIEAALAVLVWNRRARPWVLVLGVVLHLSIELSLLVGFFSLAILVAYVAFVPAEVMAARVCAAVRHRHHLPLLRRLPPPPPQP